MPRPLPSTLAALLAASEDGARQAAWEAFLAEYSTLLLRVSRLHGSDEDGRMDRYAFVIEQLRQDNCRRLRTFEKDGAGEFATWLVLVARRLCLDEIRRRYGRRQGDSEDSREQFRERRRLADLVGASPELAATQIVDPGSPETSLRASELARHLDHALAELNTRDRLLLRLRFEDGLSIPVIARMLREPSVGQTYRWLQSVLVALRHSLRAVGVDDPHP